MTKQLTIPPPHVWDRIEKILDEQDLAKKQTEKLLSDTFRRSEENRGNKFLFAAVTSISLLAFIFWNYQNNLKKQLI